MSLRDRLFKMVEEEGMNPNQFYVATGLGNGFLNTVGETLRKPSIEKLEKAFPHWNIEWLLTGKGEMTRNIATSSSQTIIGDKNITNTGVMGGGISTMDNSELMNRLIELEKEVIRLNGEVSKRDETIKGLKNELAIRIEMITFLQTKK